MPRPLNILLINCDWRDVFANSFDELRFKLDRDRLRPEHNTFFVLSFSHTSYRRVRDEHFTSLHLKTLWGRIRPLLDVSSLWRLPYHARREKVHPDVILVYDMGFLPAALIIRALCGGRVVMVLTNMPSVYSATRSWGSFKRWYASLLEKTCAGIPDLYYTINQTMSDYAQGLGIPAKNILLFSSDTITRERHLVAQAAPGFLRQKLDLNPERRIMLSVGRLEAEKDFPRLLRAFAALSPDWVLVIVGRGSLQESLEALAVELGIRERVFFEGFVSRELIWKYYRDANVFALFSKAEALGLVFWEAMYLGVPVIGSTAPGIVESLGEHGERGLLWRDPADLQAFRSAVEFTQTDNSARAAMLTNARQYVESVLSETGDLNDWYYSVRNHPHE